MNDVASVSGSAFVSRPGDGVPPPRTFLKPPFLPHHHAEKKFIAAEHPDRFATGRVHPTGGHVRRFAPRQNPAPND